MSGRFLTAVRIRALKKSESQKDCNVNVDVDERPSEGGLVIVDPAFYKKTTSDRRPYERRFHFDYSFRSPDTSNGTSTQKEVFVACGEPLIKHCFDGENCAVIAYGQTGSGKTYTMVGNDKPGGDEAGIIPRVIEGLLTESKNVPLPPDSSMTPLTSSEGVNGEVAERVVSVKFFMSYYEIHNDEVYDLLSASSDKPCIVKKEAKDDGAFVENLCRRGFMTSDVAASILREGNGKRVKETTPIKFPGSRSHVVLTVYVTQQIESVPATTIKATATPSKSSSSKTITRESKVTLVDLAGSERTSVDTGKEMQSRTKKINKSLSTLSDVVMALSLNEDKRGETIPYKNSVITWLLTNSLSGNAKISLIGTISPIDTSYDESVNTLQFLERAVVKGDAGSATQPGSSSALSGLERDDKSLLTAEITKLNKLLDVKQNIITNYENILSEQCSEGSIGSTTDQFKVLAQNYKKEKDLSSSHYHDLKTKFSQLQTEIKSDLGKVSTSRNGNQYESGDINSLRAKLDAATSELNVKTSELTVLRMESDEAIAEYDGLLRNARVAEETVRIEKDFQIEALNEQLNASSTALSLTQESLSKGNSTSYLIPTGLETELQRVKDELLIETNKVALIKLARSKLEAGQVAENLEESFEKTGDEVQDLSQELKIARASNYSLLHQLDNIAEKQALSSRSLQTQVADLLAERCNFEESIVALNAQCRNKDIELEYLRNKDLCIKPKELTSIGGAVVPTARASVSKKDEKLKSQEAWLREKEALECQLERERGRAKASSILSGQQCEAWISEISELENQLDRANEQLQLYEKDTEDAQKVLLDAKKEKDDLQEAMKLKEMEAAAITQQKAQQEQELRCLLTSVGSILARLQDKQPQKPKIVSDDADDAEVEEEDRAEIMKALSGEALTARLDAAVTGLQLTSEKAQKNLIDAETKLELSKTENQAEIERALSLKKLSSETLEHDFTSLGHLLAETKIELAMQKSENEDLQQSYRRLEKQTCALKLSMASMQEERDDMMAMKHHVDALLSKSTEVLLRR